MQVLKLTFASHSDIKFQYTFLFLTLIGIDIIFKLKEVDLPY